MADRKISDLTALTTPAPGDYVPIVDISEAADANKNKRITIEELMRRIDATSLLSLSNLMFLFAQRGKSIGIPGQPLFGVGPAVVSTTPVGIGPHDYYPIDLPSGSFM